MSYSFKIVQDTNLCIYSVLLSTINIMSSYTYVLIEILVRFEKELQTRLQFHRHAINCILTYLLRNNHPTLKSFKDVKCSKSSSSVRKEKHALSATVDDTWKSPQNTWDV